MISRKCNIPLSRICNSMLMLLPHKSFFTFNKEIAFSFRILISCPSFHSNYDRCSYWQ